MSPDFPIVLTLLSDFLSKWFWECGKTFQNSLPHHVTSTLPGGPILEKNLFSIQSVTILGHQKNTSDWNSEQKPKQVSYLYTFYCVFFGIKHAGCFKENYPFKSKINLFWMTCRKDFQRNPSKCKSKHLSGTPHRFSKLHPQNSALQHSG